jgi:hypothetical protein
VFLLAGCDWPGPGIFPKLGSVRLERFTFYFCVFSPESFANRGGRPGIRAPELVSPGIVLSLGASELFDGGSLCCFVFDCFFVVMFDEVLRIHQYHRAVWNPAAGKDGVDREFDARF